MTRGWFITFEGPEGAGKTTQARRLIARLKTAGFDVVYTREPGGTPTGEAIRGLLQHDKAGELLCPETEIFLFAASRAQLVRRVILPALEGGKVVVSDRFVDSTTAYQGYGRGFDIEQVLAINAFAIDGAVPDLTLLLDVPVELGLDRVHGRQQALFAEMDRIEREERAFHERVREGYLALARRFEDRFRVIDATRSPEEVEQEVWRHARLVVGV